MKVYEFVIVILLGLIGLGQSSPCYASYTPSYKFTQTTLPQGSITLTELDPDKPEELKKIIEEVSASKPLPIFISYHDRKDVAEWIEVLDEIQLPAEEVPLSKVRKPFRGKTKDRQGLKLAVIRTAYSCVFWFVASDFNTAQKLAMGTLIGTSQWAFTYKGWGLDILEFSRSVVKWSAKHFGYSKPLPRSFDTFMKFWTNFNVSSVLGAMMLGVLAWEDAPEVFSNSQVYKDIGFYSLMALFGTGAWNDFLSEQKFAEDPIIPQWVTHRIYQYNGVTMALSFPLMMNGHKEGVAILGVTGITGLIARFRGDKIFPWIEKKLAGTKLCEFMLRRVKPH